MKKLFISLLVIALVSATMSFALGEEIILAHDKLNPNFQPFFEEWAKMAQNEIGVTFVPVSYPSTDIFATNMKQALPTDKAPQLFTWWSTYQGAELVEADLVLDITDVWDSLKDEYTEGLRSAFTFDGKCYGFPRDLSYWYVHYNTELFKEYGLSVPKTWAELEKVCDTLVEKGVTPFNLTANDGWTSFIWFEELLLRSNPKAYEDLCAGAIRWDDPAVKNAFSIWADMIRKGYFTEASLDLFTDIPKLFTENRLGMILCGSWFISPNLDAAMQEGKVGTFCLPAMEGQDNAIIYEVGSFQVAKNIRNVDEVKRLVKYMMSKEGNGAYSKLAGSIPANPSAGFDFLADVVKDRVAEITGSGYQLHNRYWENCPTPIMAAGVECFDAFILDPDMGKLDAKLAIVQQAADEYYQ